MKIRVQRTDRDIETITLVPPVECEEGVRLSKVKGADGMDHFFTWDGYYDGWGMGFGTEGMEKEDAEEFIRKVESERAIDRGGRK